MYTALIALGIRQKVEHIMANVFLFNVFERFLFLARFYVF